MLFASIRGAVLRLGLLLLSAVIYVTFVPSVRAQQNSDARSALLVTPAWLAAHSNDAQLVILHVGPPNDYDAEHIPGARLVKLSDISVSDHEKPGGLMLQMPVAETLRQKLAALGISDNSRIVVYYGDDWVTPATRVVLTLDYAGLGSRTSLLDGGMKAWKAAGNQVTNVRPAARVGDLSALRIKPIIVDAAFVKSHVGKRGFSIVDGRAAAFYDGVQTGEGMSKPHKTGHIAGAKSVPFTEITDQNLKLRSQEQLAALFTKAGVKPGDTVVGYCHIGQQATGMLFAARLLGHPVLLYDGSFEDWSMNGDNPVENPSAKGGK